jgi:hypothetical protein
MEKCEYCGVPSLIGQGHRWEPNGVISLAGSPHNRMVFFDCEIIDEVFRGIERLLGMPIEHIIIESRARETKRYIERIYPPETWKVSEGNGQGDGEGRERLRETIRNIGQNIIDIGHVYGYGHTWRSDLWDKGDPYPWRVQIVREPYSILFAAADNLGSIEVMEGIDMWVRYEEIERDTYRVEVYPGDHPVELKQRLKRRRYSFKPGDMDYERCPECGLPLEVARRNWDPENGLITDPDTGRRMALFGPLGVDAIFDDLEEELGGVIPDTVIEAMRRYIRIAWAVEEWRRDAENFRRMIALRGLGNLVSFEGDRSHLTLTVENSALHLPMVGAIQALVEMAYRVDRSQVEWELAEDGDLTVSTWLR